MKRHVFKYPENPGWKDATVSKDNAEANRVRFNRMQARVLRLYYAGFIGTADEAAVRLGITPFSARPRCTELLKMGYLQKARRDRSRPGRHAWILAATLAPLDLDDLFGSAEPDGQPDEQQEWHDYDPEC